MDNKAQISHALPSHEALPRWTFVMLNPDQMRYVLRSIKSAKRPDSALRVWVAALTHVRRNTGEITASYRQLAEDAAASYEDVSRAMGDLTRIGALIREKQGSRLIYYINPSVGWNGEEGTRQKAARNAPQLRSAR